MPLTELSVLHWYIHSSHIEPIAFPQSGSHTLKPFYLCTWGVSFVSGVPFQPLFGNFHSSCATWSGTYADAWLMGATQQIWNEFKFHLLCETFFISLAVCLSCATACYTSFHERLTCTDGALWMVFHVLCLVLCLLGPSGSCAILDIKWILVTKSSLFCEVGFCVSGMLFQTENDMHHLLTPQTHKIWC